MRRLQIAVNSFGVTQILACQHSQRVPGLSSCRRWNLSTSTATSWESGTQTETTSWTLMYPDSYSPIIPCSAGSMCWGLGWPSCMTSTSADGTETSPVSWQIRLALRHHSNSFHLKKLANNTEPTFLCMWLQLNGLRNAIHNMMALHNGQGLSLVSQQRIVEYKQEIR